MLGRPTGFAGGGAGAIAGGTEGGAAGILLSPAWSDAGGVGFCVEELPAFLAAEAAVESGVAAWARSAAGKRIVAKPSKRAGRRLPVGRLSRTEEGWKESFGGRGEAKSVSIHTQR